MSNVSEVRTRGSKGVVISGRRQMPNVEIFRHS